MIATPVDWLRRATRADQAEIEAVQHAAYADTAKTIGRTPIPLTWDYAEVIANWDVFVADDEHGICGVLILHVRSDDLYLESIAVDPRQRGTGLGNRLLAVTDETARCNGRNVVRLLINGLNVDRIALYERRGYRIEHTEILDDRRIVHMVKDLSVS
jgi:ribosomal protein S18 acetylase RimI-like enzyme